jgi:hypothetical protein
VRLEEKLMVEIHYKYERQGCIEVSPNESSQTIDPRTKPTTKIK